MQCAFKTMQVKTAYSNGDESLIQRIARVGIRYPPPYCSAEYILF